MGNLRGLTVIILKLYESERETVIPNQHHRSHFFCIPNRQSIELRNSITATTMLSHIELQFKTCVANSLFIISFSSLKWHSIAWHPYLSHSYKVISFCGWHLLIYWLNSCILQAFICLFFLFLAFGIVSFETNVMIFSYYYLASL